MKPIHTLLRGAVIVLAVASAAPVHAHTEQSQREQRNEKVVRDAFDLWGEGGSVFRILSPDVRWTILGSGPAAGTYSGIDDFLKHAAQPLVQRLAGPIKPNVHNIWAVGDQVIIRFDGSATTTSGTIYTNQFVWIFTMHNEQVVEAEAFLDLVAYQAVIDSNPTRAE